jgi:septal ring factor EnvC (AmiA/AmiB activator)
MQTRLRNIKLTLRGIYRGFTDTCPVAAVLILACGTCMMPAASSADDNAARIENTKSVLEQWVQTKRIISQEKMDLALAEEMLNERIELARNEIESLNAKIKDAEESIDQADKKRQEMIDENEKLKESSSTLFDIVGSLEAKAKNLLTRLPDPIRERVKPLSRRIPDDTQESKLSLAERFQNVVGILNEIDKFNREISLLSEVRNLDDGTSVEVTAMYIGIGYGCYVSGDGRIAGTATPTDDGWVWKPATQAASQIAEAIAIMKNEKAATFVQLPVEIK